LTHCTLVSKIIATHKYSNLYDTHYATEAIQFMYRKCWTNRNRAGSLNATGQLTLQDSPPS